MRHLAYLVALVVPLAATAVVDRRFGLVLWGRRLRAVTVLALGVLTFLGWDLVAVHEGFYHRGHTALMTDVDVVPGLPVEEVLFVVFFCYLALVVHRLALGLLAGAPARSDDEEVPVR